MAKVYSKVSWVYLIDDKEFLDVSAEKYQRAHKDEDTSEFKWLIGSLLANVTWFPNGEFNATLAKEQLLKCNWRMTDTIEAWLNYAEKHCNEIKQECI